MTVNSCDILQYTLQSDVCRTLTAKRTLRNLKWQLYHRICLFAVVVVP